VEANRRSQLIKSLVPDCRGPSIGPGLVVISVACSFPVFSQPVSSLVSPSPDRKTHFHESLEGCQWQEGNPDEV
jgi:hypothetical protein